MIIYFGHSLRDYNTEKESKEIERIIELYPECEIINPKDIIAPKSKDIIDAQTILNKYFIPIIKGCDIFCYSKTKKGKLTYGVRKELEYAEFLGLNIVEV